MLAARIGGDHQRLEDPVFADRFRQPLQLAQIHIRAGLARVGNDLTDWQIGKASRDRIVLPWYQRS